MCILKKDIILGMFPIHYKGQTDHESNLLHKNNKNFNFFYITLITLKNCMIIIFVSYFLSKLTLFFQQRSRFIKNQIKDQIKDQDIFT